MNKFYHTKGLEVMNTIAEGNAAPDFTLQNQAGDSVSLSDFKGKKNVVVYFYPKAMTPGCTVQACGIRDTQAELNALNTVVLGISPDPVARLEKFRLKENLNFDLLADEDHSVADSYGVWGLKKFMGKEYMGIHRMSFIIDKEGIVRHVMLKVKTKTHDHDVIDIIKEKLL